MKKLEKNDKKSDMRPQWTFFSNHAHVLILLVMNPARVLREIALEVGITERAVQKIVSELADGGYLKKIRVGRNNEYHLKLDQPLRHPIEKHKTIGDVIRVIAPQTK